MRSIPFLLDVTDCIATILRVVQARRLTPQKLGAAVETAFFKHIYSRYYDAAPRFAYWTGRNDHEVDVVACLGDRNIPFEVKYQDTPLQAGDLVGLRLFCETRAPDYAYVITQRWTEFGAMTLRSARRGSKEMLPTKVVRIPAPLACLVLS